MGSQPCSRFTGCCPPIFCLSHHLGSCSPALWFSQRTAIPQIGTRGPLSRDGQRPSWAAPCLRAARARAGLGKRPAWPRHPPSAPTRPQHREWALCWIWAGRTADLARPQQLARATQ